MGLITYMRTDSTRIADEAAQEALALINQRFGKAYAIAKPRFFKNKNKAQDAHEAIRPTSVYHTPESGKRYLSKDQAGLVHHDLATVRRIPDGPGAHRSEDPLHRAGDYTFTASGSSVKFPGFLACIKASTTRRRAKKGSRCRNLPEKSPLELLGIDPKQHFTAAPATIFRSIPGQRAGRKRHRPTKHLCGHSLHHSGQGLRGLVKGYFQPTELGFIVNDLLLMPASRRSLMWSSPPGWKTTWTGWNKTKRMP